MYSASSRNVARLLLQVARVRCAHCTPALPSALLSPDVDSITGLCADGMVRIGWCSSQRKGLGAFAARHLKARAELGLYTGEILTFGDLLARYGAGGVDSPFEYESANKQAAWMAEREARGVGVTGQYVFNAGPCPTSRRDVLVDAEDPSVANWTRYINHSPNPNLEVT
mmetsp:Transcript_15546/g.40181  ORF Transcript_15546/g.40181 Transcript_15546/m.40181 type:complete len:169 (+) Transcript_15546:149-655(+)|eukprot:CAMPEP_0115853426 /NCGR_PEP_ID=MMETSP0287-20121206/13497_1 /TAXON_ID=412157 /ORGANISM="Chrysochromulina rotalis, Strain UIO044" /LENGTH=168 /DNA_ID=CAMNT_0003307501 /DNA_START=130 /DNA_END=636 /DNA_ORIENTATION=-